MGRKGPPARPLGPLQAKSSKKLKADGRLYACYETQEELALKRKTQLSMGKPPIYDRSSQ